MQKVSSGSLAKCMFLFVIVGCEMDLYGFAMSYPEYFDFGSTKGNGGAIRFIMRACCIIMPLGYIVSVIMYMNLSKNTPSDQVHVGDDQSMKTLIGDEENPLRPEALAVAARSNSTKQPNSACNANNASSFISLPPERLVPKSHRAARIGREPTDLKLYHFIPIVRYYLIIKDQEPSDVEGVFRVNSLSSFTLGICQIVCMLMAKFVLQDPVTIFVKINIASQAINWLITLLYFSTPICKRMKSMTQIDALNHNSDEELKRQSEEWYKLVQERGAEIGAYDKETPHLRKLTKRMEAMKRMAIHEIRAYSSNDALELEILNWEQLHEVRGFLRRRFILAFAEIGVMGSETNDE